MTYRHEAQRINAPMKPQTALQFLGIRPSQLDHYTLRLASERKHHEILARIHDQAIQRREFESMRQARAVLLQRLDEIAKHGLQLTLF